MSERNVLLGGFPASVAALVCGALLLGATAPPAAAYVVVTSDNRVFDIESKPQLSGDLVLFTLDGHPVSLRMYDVNVAKTNELNHHFDTGANASALQAQVRALRPAVPQDDRIIVSSRLERMLDQEYGEDAGIARREMYGEMPSFDRDRPGTRRAEAPRPFEREARDAMSEAEERVRTRNAPEPEPAESERPARRTARASARDAGRVADLDAEIAAEQAYLAKLTAGELSVADLEGEIDRSMTKIKRLQRRRADASADAAETGAAAAASDAPSGSREARWQAELRDAEAELGRLQSQQSAASGSAREREGIDERIGELQWKIERLRRRLGQ